MNCSVIDTTHGPLGLYWDESDRPIKGLELLMKTPRKSVAAPAALRPVLEALIHSRHNTTIAWALDLCDWSTTTAFRRRVYECLFATVPAGKLVTYGDLARQLDPPTAARAIGGAMRHNPFPVLIPCHRCVASSGIGGFMGNVPGAIDRKLMMLQEEGAWVAPA